MKNNLLTLGLIGALVMASSCNRSAERPAFVNKKIAGNLIALKDIAEITGEKANVYVKGEDAKDKVTEMNSTLEQVSLAGSKAETILKKVTNKAHKKAINDHLATPSGAIALVVLKDQIKILKVVAETEVNLNYDVLSLHYLKKVKASHKAADIQAQSQLARQAEEQRLVAPSTHGEKSGLVEVTSIKLEKVGVLENERTPYNEKKSSQEVVEASLEVATHALLGAEVCEKASSEEEEKEEKK